MLEVRDLRFSYQVDTRKVEVLKGLNFKVEPGEFVAIQGPSGSGKSTLFYMLGFLLKPTSGRILFDGADITQLSDDELTLLRNQRIGFVFQQFHLLAKTSALDNILLPAQYPSEIAAPGPRDAARARELAEKLGIQNHLGHLPNQLSGGQQQRVAIARALMKDVDLILADEPTGNLDSQTASETLDLLEELNRQGKTIILITHDGEVARRCAKTYHLRDGEFVHLEENREAPGLAAVRQARKNSVPELSNQLHPEQLRRMLVSSFPLVMANILRNKVKSALTMLGVVIGIAAVLAMVTLGQFTKMKILGSYETLGVNKLLIRGYPNWNRKATDQVSINFLGFDYKKDLLKVKEIFPEIQLLSPALHSWQQTAISGGVSVDQVQSMGVTPEYFAITNRKLILGRIFSPFNVDSRSPVCVIGYEIAQRLFSHSNPLGQIVSITDGRQTSFPCEVIGVMASVTSNQSWAKPNLNVLLPYTYFETTTGDSWYGQIHETVMKIRSGADIEKTGKEIKAYFSKKYGKSGDFFVGSDSTLIAQMKKFLNLFSVLLTGIALLSLLVGGIGINNMMMVSVTERIKEFGIRKALGATHRSIRLQVLMESLVLCLAAGLIGVMLGFAAYELLIFGASKLIPTLKFEWVFEPLAALLSVVSIVSVGIASGFIPALKAEKLQVIEALRAE